MYRSIWREERPHLSSLHSDASILDLCGPAGARIAQVTAHFSRCNRSAWKGLERSGTVIGTSQIWPPKVCCERSQYFEAASRNFLAHK